jgi:hypothetical protein
VAAVLVAVLLLAACNVGASGDNGPGAGGPSSGSDGTAGDADPTPYLPVPDGVGLADPGSELGLGESANIAWKLDDGQVGVLAVKVRKLVHAKISDLANWQLDKAGRRSSLYYVTATVANLGDADLGGLRVPLFVLDGAGAFVESSEFKTDFDPCPSLSLPAGFVAGQKVTICQAYLVPKHGKLAAVAFRATPKFNPVRWVGKVQEPKPPRKSGKS